MLEDEGVPPVVVHAQDVGFPVEASVSVMAEPVQPVLEELMAAVGVVAETPVKLILSIYNPSP